MKKVVFLAFKWKTINNNNKITLLVVNILYITIHVYFFQVDLPFNNPLKFKIRCSVKILRANNLLR